MTPLDIQQQHKTERLTDAFRIFNQLSENLATSYHSLEEQVAQLNAELVAARSERVNSLVEKEKLANRLQHILAALPAAVIVLNAFGQVIDCNHQAIDFLGEPLLGQEWQTLVARRLQPVPGSPRERQLLDGRKVNITRNGLRNDAEQVILLSDVSELRSLQELLAQQKQLSAMGEMVASLAHQVRTPLATAILYASQMNRPTLDDTKRQQFSQKILERLHYLERQVNDMLIYAKQGRLAMERVSLHSVLSHLHDGMELFAGQFSVDNQLTHDQLLGNADALRGALMNLLNNAIEAGAQSIHLSITQPDADSICISVADNGPGIPPAQQLRVFEPFFTTKSQGTGLGLAVVDSVIRAHNGRISCQSTVGQGTVFSVTLPCRDDFSLNLSAAHSTQEIRHESV